MNLESFTTSSSVELKFDLLTINEYEKMVEDSINDAVLPYKKLCQNSNIEFPEDWCMIFHTSYRHPVPDVISDRVVFSDMVDDNGKPAIILIDKKTSMHNTFANNTFPI